MGCIQFFLKLGIIFPFIVGEHLKQQTVLQKQLGQCR